MFSIKRIAIASAAAVATSELATESVFVTAKPKGKKKGKKGKKNKGMGGMPGMGGMDDLMKMMGEGFLMSQNTLFSKAEKWLKSIGHLQRQNCILHGN